MSTKDTPNRPPVAQPAPTGTNFPPNSTARTAPVPDVGTVPQPAQPLMQPPAEPTEGDSDKDDDGSRR